MTPSVFKPTIPASERLQTHALDRAATGIVSTVVCNKEFKNTKKKYLVSDVANPPNNVLLSVFTTTKKKLRGLIPHANYTDRAAAAGRRN